MSSELRRHLRGFTWDEIDRWDLRLSLVAALGAGTWEALRPGAIAPVVPIAAGLVGVVIGAVVAGAAVVAAFLDQRFLRKLRLIGRRAERYVTPFMFTASIGVTAALLLLLLSVLPEPGWRPVNVGIAGAAVGAATWTLSSMVQNLSTLLEFIGLQTEAAGISEEKLVELERRAGDDEDPPSATAIR